MLRSLCLAHRRFLISSILIVVVALTLLACFVQHAGSATTAEAAHPSFLAPHQVTGRIVVQLFRVPGFIYPSINAVPEWTLYADGSLIFKGDTDPDLMQAHLSSGQVNSILTVIVRQNSFFASTRPAYGRIIPDMGSTLLTVDINGMRKQVRVYGQPSVSVDEQTRHIFAITKFLHEYRPAAAQLYIPPGVVLVALAQNEDTADAPAWQYHDISLSQTFAQECPLVLPGSTSCPALSGGKTGVLALLGQRGLALLQQAHNTSFLNVKEQGKVYRLLVWPLLPDALYPRPNGVMSVQIQGANSTLWPLIFSR